jgi:hypothetical protein
MAVKKYISARRIVLTIPFALLQSFLVPWVLRNRLPNSTVISRNPWPYGATGAPHRADL